MHKEIDTFLANETWELVVFPIGYSLITCKWMFRVKFTSDGSMDKYKALLVTRSFLQEFVVDYLDTFSPIVKTIIIIIVLYLAMRKCYFIRQVDVNIVFL